MALDLYTFESASTTILVHDIRRPLGYISKAEDSATFTGVFYCVNYDSARLRDLWYRTKEQLLYPSMYAMHFPSKTVCLPLTSFSLTTFT